MREAGRDRSPYARQRLGLRSNTKARNAAVHYRLHAVGNKSKEEQIRRYRKLQRATTKNGSPPVRRRVMVCNTPPHCVPWHCSAILSFALKKFLKLKFEGTKDFRVVGETCKTNATYNLCNLFAACKRKPQPPWRSGKEICKR